MAHVMLLCSFCGKEAPQDPWSACRCGSREWVEVSTADWGVKPAWGGHEWNLRALREYDYVDADPVAFTCFWAECSCGWTCGHDHFDSPGEARRCGWQHEEDTAGGHVEACPF